MKIIPLTAQVFFLRCAATQQLIRAAHEEDKRLHDAYFDLLKTDHPDKARVDFAGILSPAAKALFTGW